MASSRGDFFFSFFVRNWSSEALVSICLLFSPGCYDGCVYFLCTTSGETQWTFQTGDAVKSCPAVDPLSGLVIVGSHDGHVYALNPEVRTIHAKPLIMRISFFPFALQKQWIMSVFHFISYLLFFFTAIKNCKKTV